jgi:hypothetical protein
MGTLAKIEKQAKEAEEKQRQLAEAGKTGTEKEKQGQAPEPEKGKEEVPKAQEKETPQKPVKEETEESFKQKYEVLQGKYNAEMPRLREQIANLQQTVTHLNSIIASQPKPLEGEEEESKKPVEIPAVKELQAGDFEGYGEEMLQMVKTVNELIKENQGLKAENQKLTGEFKTVGQTVIKSAKERYYDRLDDLVPDLFGDDGSPKINADPNWLQWLSKVDTLSGRRRQDLLDDAQNKLDAERVAAIVNLWKGESGRQPQTVPSETSSQETPKLEDQVEAPRGPAGFDTGAPQMPVVSAAELRKAAADRIHGRITEEQFQKISDDFQRTIQRGIAAGR